MGKFVVVEELVVVAEEPVAVEEEPVAVEQSVAAGEPAVVEGLAVAGELVAVVAGLPPERRCCSLLGSWIKTGQHSQELWQGRFHCCCF